MIVRIQTPVLCIFLAIFFSYISTANGVARDAEVPVPVPRPVLQDNGNTGDRALPAGLSPEADQDFEIKAGEGDDSAGLYASCAASLKALDVSFNWKNSNGTGDCTFYPAVEIVSVGSGSGVIMFPQKPVLACAFAETFSRWTRDIAAPVMLGLTGRKITAVTTGPGFVCRNRAGGGGAKLSEHAKGNAIDISAFNLAGAERLRIGSNFGEEEDRALKAMRLSACGYFTTVLGPGANADHATHFHFDNGVHGRSGNYRICE